MKKKIANPKTEEVQDIIDRMPQRTARKVAIIVVSLATILIVLGWIIHYPDSVTGAVTLTAKSAPVCLVAETSGKIHFLHNGNEVIKEDTPIAYVESGIEIRGIFFIDSILSYSLLKLKKKQLNRDLKLGELTTSYLKFVNSVEEFQLFKQEASYVSKIRQLKFQEETTARKLKSFGEQFPLFEEAHAIKEINFIKDSIQFHQLKTINEPSYLSSRASWLNSLQDRENHLTEIDLAKNRLKELTATIKQLRVEEKVQIKKLELKIEAGRNELRNNLALWQQKYMFIAPCSGKLEMLNFWKENAFIRAGEEVCAILPQENPVIAEVLLPSRGAGKVRKGQEVIIKLDNYPYLEYGSIQGEVISISMLTNRADRAMAEQNIDSYKVFVKLPQQLTTNYGSKLAFNHNMKGIAQILVRKRRLIERLFDNLKYMTNE